MKKTDETNNKIKIIYLCQWTLHGLFITLSSLFILEKILTHITLHPLFHTHVGAEPKGRGGHFPPSRPAKKNRHLRDILTLSCDGFVFLFSFQS